MAESIKLHNVEVTKNMMLFSGSQNPELAEKISKHLGVDLGNVKLKAFENGEVYARYLDSVRGSDVFLIQSVSGKVNDALMELLVMTDAAKRASARSVTAVIAHYGYSRQDKKSAAREPITAKLVANLLTVAGVGRIITVDLHQGQIQGFFDIPVNHLTALPIFADYFLSKKLKDICIVSPDVGRAKAAKKLSDMLDANLAIMQKTRPDHNAAEITNVIGDVNGKTCILNDDMIDTAGSVVAAIAALKKEGAQDVYICATHGLFSGPAYERLAHADVKEVVICDTVPVPLERQTGKIHVVTVAPLLAHAIANVFLEASVSELFDPEFAL
ncbi:MAG: ribose-phosphate pyrophosphokinase [Coriobacteriales bacterium]|jgi:ribose-phosphate pyrophosphokinase|nr:ribose-phosphate pyrophosphokinase [Coriobacteriales bacterium]